MAVGLSACSDPITAAEMVDAETYAAAIAEHLSDPARVAAVADGEVRGEQVLADVDRPDRVHELVVLDVGVSTATTPDETVVGVDAAVAMDFAGRDEMLCVLASATSAGGANGAVGETIPLDECDHSAATRLRRPYITSQQMINAYLYGDG